MVMCSVTWCAAVATVGAHCPIHAKDATLHPRTLADDEEAVDGVTCHMCNGSGECENCNSGECSDECFSCGADGHDCGKCDGTGECPTCKGEGTLSYRKKDEA